MNTLRSRTIPVVRLLAAGVIAVIALGCAGCGSASGGHAAGAESPASTALTTLPTIVAPQTSAPTSSTVTPVTSAANAPDVIAAKQDLQGVGSLLSGAADATSAANPSAAQAQEGSAP